MVEPITLTLALIAAAGGVVAVSKALYGITYRARFKVTFADGSQRIQCKGSGTRTLPIYITMKSKKGVISRTVYVHISQDFKISEYRWADERGSATTHERAGRFAKMQYFEVFEQGMIIDPGEVEEIDLDVSSPTGGVYPIYVTLYPEDEKSKLYHLEVAIA